jgi:hypothetical protein
VRAILAGAGAAPPRAEVAAELVLFVRETTRELGERRAGGFLKKFYGWYLRGADFPKQFVQELVRLDSTDAVVERVLVAEPGAADVLAVIDDGATADDGTLVPLPISAYGGG